MAPHSCPLTLRWITSNITAVSSGSLTRKKKKTDSESNLKIVLFVSVYHEDSNAAQRHHRHKEPEPKPRPLRVGDTEKPGLEGMTLHFQVLREDRFFVLVSYLVFLR